MDLNTINKFKTAYNKIIKAKNILLVTHERPDGDAIASVCALIDLMEKINKKYTVFCQDNPTSNYSWLPFINKLTTKRSLVENLTNYDLIIILDCGNKERTGIANKINSKNQNQFLIEFDHHLKVDDYTDLEIRFSEAAATTEVLYYFFKINNLKITKNVANCILTGILTDTANFLYHSTSNKTAKIASEMLSYGANFPKIVEKTWRNKNLSSIKLFGTALNNLIINKKYNLAFSILSLAEIKKYKNDEDIFDGIANFLGNLYGVKGVMFLREEENEKIKGSLRSSHPKADMSKLANFLGGGGHTKASGFSIKGKFKREGNKWKIE